MIEFLLSLIFILLLMIFIETTWAGYYLTIRFIEIIEKIEAYLNKGKG